jgi:DNA-binding NtrC family response regulator
MDKKYTILCVDDEEAILRGMEKLLSLEGYKVFVASNGRKALEIMEREPIDLILADQRMPDIQGSELLAMVREKYPSTIRILFSGYTDFTALVSAINEGQIYRFIIKPWDTKELVSTIATALEQKRLMGIISSFSEEFKKLAHIREKTKLKINQTPNSINILFEGEERLISDESISRFLELVLETINAKLTDQEKLKITSGIIARQKDKIVFTIDLTKGLALNIEFF